MKRIIVSVLIAMLAFGSVACSAQTDNINTMNETKVDSQSNIRDFDEFLTNSAFDNETYIEPVLELDEPTVENGKIIFNVNTNIDTANIIVALYDENAVLSAVKTNTNSGKFDADGGKSYSIKAFAWASDTLEPMTSSSVRSNIAVPKSVLKEYLNNTMETTDGTLHYTYYLPANYDANRAYPMLVTCPGWSSLFNTIETTPLTENRHARENAEVWTELGGDMIIVSPSLTDWGEKSARQTIELTGYFIDNFSVDTARIYASGFSAGGETLSRVVDKKPDLFAAYLHCGSQWDGGYDNAANSRLSVYVAMAENDSYYHSGKAQEAYDGLKKAYEKAGAAASDIDDLLVLDLKENAYFDAGVTDYHAGGYYIMQDKGIIRWMLGKRKSDIKPTPTPVTFELFTSATKINDVINDDAFGNYGRLIFPADTSYYSGDTLGNLRLTWYSGINADKTVEICNYMKEKALSGDMIFYDIYTDAEKAADSAKKDTGLFFFKGDENAKFAIVNAGGGFAYVGAMHDSFPHALELSKKGYNAFALIYRPGWDTAMEDLARAIAFIHEHADELGVDTTDYSLWGGSAGARMAATLGSYTTDNYGEKKYPLPTAVIMQYTGHSEVTGTEPPTYNCVGTADGIASYQTMQSRIDRIKANGTDTMIEIFDGLPHGFGIGEGTIAYGWLDNAVEFWERNMK